MEKQYTNEEIEQMRNDIELHVKNGTSKAFNLMTRRIAITADAFLEEVRWLCEAPAVDCDGRGYRAVGIRKDGSCAHLSVEYRLDPLYNTYYLPYYHDTNTGSADLQFAFLMRIDNIKQFCIE